MNAFQLLVRTKYFRDYQVEGLFFFHSMFNRHWKTRVLHLQLLLRLIRLIKQLLKVVEIVLDAFSKMLKILLSACYDQIRIEDNDQVHHFFIYCSHILTLIASCIVSSFEHPDSKLEKTFFSVLIYFWWFDWLLIFVLLLHLVPYLFVTLNF